MFETAILHVGMPKTGSSSLQRFLEVNSKSLTQKGFIYVDSYGDVLKSALAVYIAGPRDTAHYQAIRQGLSQADLAKKIKTHLTQLTESASDGDTLLISSEFLWEAGMDVGQRKALAEILKPFVRNIRIIAYLRRQDRLVNSSITTRLKTGLPTPLENLGKLFSPGASRYDYGGSLDGWAETFGADNVEARILEAGKLVGNDVVEDYASRVGIDLAGLNQEKFRANPALSLKASAFLVEVERWIPFFKNERRNRERMRLNWALDEHFAAPIRWVDQKSARLFVEHYGSSNAKVADYVRDLDIEEVFDTDFSDYPEIVPEFGSYSFGDAVEFSAVLWQHSEKEIGELRDDKITLSRQLVKERKERKSLSDQQNKERNARKFFSDQLNKERKDRKFFSEQLNKERKDRKLLLDLQNKERNARKFFSDQLNKERKDRKFFSEQLDKERKNRKFLSDLQNKERKARKFFSDQLNKERKDRKFFQEQLNKERKDRKFYSEQLAKERKDKKFLSEQLEKERKDRKFFSERLNVERKDRKFYSEQLAKERRDKKFLSEQLEKERKDRKFFSERLNVERANMHFLSGQLNKERGNYPDAIKHFEKAVSLKDEVPENYQSLLESTRGLLAKAEALTTVSTVITPPADHDETN